MSGSRDDSDALEHQDAPNDGDLAKPGPTRTPPAHPPPTFPKPITDTLKPKPKPKPKHQPKDTAIG